ncbi:hypothetical protein [Agrobacterium tumefaciens]|uniref:hypothetical protein n=1 Tax=Agrobacterium tumefaciens TaxID=358 RepID=UPI0015747B0B|nr:hypothetical protein [Agrobacterium tumefaciens]NSX90363.1 hypothetical protein [Agrobacterium tumefaciens]
MPTFQVNLPDESACDQCGKMLALDIVSCPDCQNSTYRMTFGEFYGDYERFRMMDARYGGLVLGRSDKEDDIPMYICRHGGVYTLVGMMQGGEYIMSRAATSKHGAILEQFNSEQGEVGEINFPLTSKSSVINTNFMPPLGGIWITEGQFIVNRYATKIHFDKLEVMNAEANLELAALMSEEDGTAEMRSS